MAEEEKKENNPENKNSDIQNKESEFDERKTSEKPKEKHESEKPKIHEHSDKHKEYFKQKHKSKSLSDKIEVLPKLRENPWMVSTFILAIVVAYFLIMGLGQTNPTMHGKVISADEAGNKVLELAKNNIKSKDITLTSVTEKSGLYEVTLSVDGRELPVYITQDGENLINGLISIKTLEAAVNEQNRSNQNNQQTEIPKTDKPSVELFVMSFCPFGNRAEDTMLPVYELLKDKVNWSVHYIVSASGDTIRSLHGQKEVEEDMRELCVLNKSGLDKFWGFITYVNKNCGSDGSCWQDAARNNSIDINEIENCVNTQGKDMLKQEAVISSSKGVSGSPTLFINGVRTRDVYQYGNSEAYKSAICSGFSNSTLPVTECGQQLSASTSTSTGGSCN